MIDGNIDRTGIAADRQGAAAGLETKQTTTGGGNADRAAAIAGMRKRHHARGDQCRGATGGPAGDPAEIIRVAGGARDQRLGRGNQTHFRAGRLAEIDHTCLAPGFGKLTIIRSDIAFKGARAVQGLRPFPVEQVLDESWHAAKRSFGWGLCGVSCAVIAFGGDRIDHRMSRLGAGDRCFCQGQRGGLATGQLR